MHFNFLKKLIPAIVLISLCVSILPPQSVRAAIEPERITPGVENPTTGRKNVQPLTIPEIGQTPEKEAAELKTIADKKAAEEAKKSTQLECAGITSCLAVITYMIGPGLASYAAYIGAYFFSITIKLALNSTAYALNFLTTGWTTVRDIANMSFIFILIYLAITIMMSAETGTTLRTLAAVIVIGLLVNFSFFFTRVVIDTGNILALQFYNAITVPPGETGLIAGTQVKDLSTAIMGAIKPQSLLDKGVFERAQKSAGNSAWAGLGIVTTIYLSMAAILWILAFAFLQVGIMFVMRIIGLWMILIVAPLAFVARTMESTKKYFDQWLHGLIAFSLYPAVFLFMFLMLNRFAGDMLTAGTNNQGSGDFFSSMVNAITSTSSANPLDIGLMAAIASIAIRMGFIVGLLYLSLKVSDMVAAQGGVMGVKASGAAIGMSGYVAKGIQNKSLSLASRGGSGMYNNTVGKGAARVSTALANTKWGNTSRIGNVLQRASTTAANTSIAGNKSFIDSQKMNKDTNHEREKNLGNIKLREDAKRLGEINNKIKEYDTKEQISIILTPKEFNEREALRNEQYGLTKNIEKASGDQLLSLSAKNIENITAQITKAHVDALKKSTAHTHEEIGNIVTKWNKENEKAPLQQAHIQLESLGKISEALTNAGIHLDKVKNISLPIAGTTVVVDSRNVVGATREMESEKGSWEAIRDDTGALPAARKEARENVKNITKGIEHLTKLAAHVEDIPEHVGKSAPAASFQHKG